MCNMTELTRNQLAELFGVNPSTISWHKSAGMPVNEDGRTFDAPACVQWLLARVEQAVSKDSGETDESRHWLTQFRKERAKTARIERLKAEEKLIAREDILTQWLGRLRTLRSDLLNLATRLPPILEARGQLEMRQLIDDEVCRMLNTYARGGKYSPDTTEVKQTMREFEAFIKERRTTNETPMGRRKKRIATT